MSNVSAAVQGSKSKRDAVLWRRLHEPGHDACRLVEDRQGWCLEGAAVFLHEGAPACLSYRVVGTPDWLPLHGYVKGFIGSNDIDVTITRDVASKWLLNGTPVTGLEDCDHLDFGFTPATNLPHLRWLHASGQTSAPVPVAWLKVPGFTLERLPQQYTRLTELTYWYEAPSENFAAELSTSPNGFVLHYPGLWHAAE